MALEKLRNNNLKERQEHNNSFDKNDQEMASKDTLLNKKKVYEILSQKMNGAVSTFIK